MKIKTRVLAVAFVAAFASPAVAEPNVGAVADLCFHPQLEKSDYGTGAEVVLDVEFDGGMIEDLTIKSYKPENEIGKRIAEAAQRAIIGCSGPNYTGAPDHVEVLMGPNVNHWAPK